MNVRTGASGSILFDRRSAALDVEASAVAARLAAALAFDRFQILGFDAHHAGQLAQFFRRDAAIHQFLEQLLDLFFIAAAGSLRAARSLGPPPPCDGSVPLIRSISAGSVMGLSDTQAVHEGRHSWSHQVLGII